jgi:RNA polymerase sigma-70 factor (ECF subfamily)
VDIRGLVNNDKERIYQELLALRCQRGDAGAFEELVRLWEQRLFYYVRRLVREEQDAWDVLQEVWLKACRGLPSLRQAKSLPVWLYRIAHHSAISHLRETPDEESLSEEHAGWIQETDIQFRSEDAERVHFGLNRIAWPWREVLTLHFLDDLSVQEIAEIISVPEGTVKSRLYHAKRALKRVLEQESAV